MDYNWALAELQSFIDLTELVSPPYTPGDILYPGDDRVTKGKTDVDHQECSGNRTDSG